MSKLEQSDLEQERIWFLHFKKDPEQYEKIVTEYSPVIFGYLFRKSGDYDTTEELTQETFVEAFSGFRKFEWRGISLRAFLIRIARNVFNTWYRNKMKICELPIDSSELVLVSGETPEMALSTGEDKSLIASCVDRLPELQREIFDLFYWNDLKPWEIAKILKIRENTVKSHLHRGKLDLMGQLIAMGLDQTSFSLISDAKELQMFREHDWNIVKNSGREGTSNE